MKHLLSIVVCLIIALLANAQVELIEIESAIQISNNLDTTPDSGTIRWNGSDFEGWNGTSWVSLTGGNTPSVADISGNEYRTTKIGEQVWMAENLKTSKYNDGQAIPRVIPNAVWLSLDSGAYSWYDNDQSADEELGKLYNWYVVETGKICPSGWRVPSILDFEILVENLGYHIGRQLKAIGSRYWTHPNDTSLDKVNFNARGSGLRSSIDGAFKHIDRNFIMWFQDEESASEGMNLLLTDTEPFHWFHDNKKQMGASIRCIQNN